MSYKLALSRYAKLQNRAARCSKKRKFEAKLLDKTPKFNDEAWLRQAITSKIRRLVMSKASGGIAGRRRSLSMENEHFDLEVEQVNFSPQKDEMASAMPEKVTEQDITSAQDDIDRVSTVVEDLKKKKSELFTKLKLALKEERTRQKIEAQEAAKRKKQHEVMAAAAETEAAAEQRKMASRPPPPPPPSAPPQRDASQRESSQREAPKRDGSGPPPTGRRGAQTRPICLAALDVSKWSD